MNKISRHHLERIVDNLSEPIYWMDKNGYILGCNKIEAELFGFKEVKDIIGKNVYDVAQILGWSKKVADKLRRNDKKIMRTRKSESVEEKVFSLDGQERIFLSHKAPFYDEKNNVAGIVGISFEITKRKKNELDVKEKLRMSNIYLQNILNNLPEPIYWIDKNSVILGCNEAEANIFGLSVRDIVGKNMVQIGKLLNWDKKIAQDLMKNDAEIMRTKIGKHVEELGLGPNGEVKTYFSHKAPLFDEKNNVIGIIGTTIDISQRKKMEEDLLKAKERAEAADRVKTEFIANMSHDVKTPLAGIISISELLSSRVPEEYRELTHDLMEAGQHLMVFFDNCIEIAKLESEGILLSEENFNLKHLLREIVNLFQPAIKAKGLALYLNYPQTVPKSFFGSRVTLYRVLLNLIGNALKFTQEGSIGVQVELGQKSSAEKAIIKLVVSDTGMGIPFDKQEAIFQRFVRLVPSFEETYKGSGIGLYLVQKFVKAMSGEIHLKSEEGKGSQFAVIIPLKIPLLTEDEQEEDALDLPFVASKGNLVTVLPEKIKSLAPITDMAKTKILLVEDSVIAQKGSCMLLNSLGCTVDVAASGEKALKLFEPGKYKLVFMDIGLPDMKGYQVAECLREKEKGTSFCVPILGLSAHATQEERRLSSLAGIVEMILKPLLLKQANQILERYVWSLQADTGSTGERANIVADQAILNEWIASLPGCRAEIESAYKSQNMDLLVARLHRLHGDLYYTNTPELLRAVQTLETQLKHKKYEQIEILYQEILAEMKKLETNNVA